MAGERQVPGLGLYAFWTPGSDGWDAQMDGNLRTLSVLVQASVLDRVASLPGSPSDGDIYLLTSGANDKQIALRDNGAWVYLVPAEGWQIWVKDEDIYYHYDGTNWIAAADASSRVAKAGDTMTGSLTINVAADALLLISDGGTSGLGSFTKYVTNANVGSFFSLRHANGSLASPSDSASGDRMGILAFAGRSDNAFRNVAGIEGRVGTGTISATSLPSYLAFLTSADGSVARTERLRIDQNGNLGVGANIWLDANRIFRLRSYTVGTLPSSPVAGSMAYCSDWPGGGCLVVGDGSNWRSAVREPIDIGSFCAGKPAANEKLMGYVFNRALSLPSGLTDSQFYCEAAATAAKSFDITKNGSSIGTVNFAIGANTATVTFASGVSFAAGDRLRVTAPAVQDATLADIYFNFRFTRP